MGCYCLCTPCTNGKLNAEQEVVDADSYKNTYTHTRIHKITSLLKKATSRTEDSILCMRQERGVPVQNKNKSLLYHASYSNESDTRTFECHW